MSNFVKVLNEERTIEPMTERKINAVETTMAIIKDGLYTYIEAYERLTGKPFTIDTDEDADAFFESIKDACNKTKEVLKEKSKNGK